MGLKEKETLAGDPVLAYISEMYGKVLRSGEAETFNANGVQIVMFINTPMVWVKTTMQKSKVKV